MKKIVFILSILIIGISCDKDKDEAKKVCDLGISYKLDGVPFNYSNASVTAEIYPNDPNVGKIYDIWTDESNGFYFHSSVAEQGQTCGFVTNWLQQEGANIAALSQMQNQNFTFEIIEEADNVGDNVRIEFSGSYDDDNNQHHVITGGIICTTIDIVH